MRLGLVPGANLVRIAVNGKEQPVVRDGAEYLFYVLPPAEAGKPATVDFAYEVPGGRRASTGISLAAPALNAPIENLTWSVRLPSGFALRSVFGDFEMREALPAARLDSRITGRYRVRSSRSALAMRPNLYPAPGNTSVQGSRRKPACRSTVRPKRRGLMKPPTRMRGFSSRISQASRLCSDSTRAARNCTWTIRCARRLWPTLPCPRCSLQSLAARAGRYRPCADGANPAGKFAYGSRCASAVCEAYCFATTRRRACPACRDAHPSAIRICSCFRARSSGRWGTSVATWNRDRAHGFCIAFRYPFLFWTACPLRMGCSR